MGFNGNETWKYGSVVLAIEVSEYSQSYTIILFVWGSMEVRSEIELTTEVIGIRVSMGFN